MQQFPRGGGELRTLVEGTPFRETPPWLQAGAAPSPHPHGALQSRVPPEFQTSVSGLEVGLPGFEARAQTLVGLPARVGLGGREEEAERTWGGGRVEE